MAISGCGALLIWRRAGDGEVSQRLIWTLASSRLRAQRGPMARSPGRGDRVVVLIGAFKLVKSALLIALGVAWLFGSAGGAPPVRAAAAWTGALTGSRAIHRAVAKLASLDGYLLRRVAIAALCYAVVFAVEGVGLLLKKRWAEWLTVLVTASFVPFEVYEIAQRGGAAKIAALVLNVAIVAYLGWRVGARLSARRDDMVRA